MSRSSTRSLEARQSLLTTPTYPLPPLPPQTTSFPSSTRRTGSKRSLGLGINTQTGRLQWCPGFKCCKFLIVLPVVLLPVTLVLVLLMRMDGMLMALRLQRDQQEPPQQQQQQPALQQQQQTALQQSLGLAGESPPPAAAAAVASFHEQLRRSVSDYERTVFTAGQGTARASASGSGIAGGDTDGRNNYAAGVGVSGVFRPVNVADDGFIVDEQLLLPYHRHRHHPHQQRYFHGDDQQDEGHGRVEGRLARFERLVVKDFKDLSKWERLRRCLSFRYGQSETIDVEDRDLMKDARTSFLPAETLTAIPRECFETLDEGKLDRVGAGGSDDGAGGEGGGDDGETGAGSGDTDDERRNGADTVDYEAIVEFFRSRQRRTSQHEGVLPAAAAATDEGDEKSQTAQPNEGGNFNSDVDAGAQQLKDEEARYAEAHAAILQSFWNEQGTKESIREAQAQTMKRYMNTAVDPCEDFFRYSCGNWERMHPIPRDKAGFDTFEMLRENLDAVLKQLLESRDIETKRTVAAPLQHNTFEAPEQAADIVKSPIAIDQKAAVVVDNSGEATRQRNQQEEKARLRRYIVKHRSTLGRLLARYRRQTTNTKRKRLIAQLNSATPANVLRVVTDQPNSAAHNHNANIAVHKMVMDTVVHNNMIAAGTAVPPTMFAEHRMSSHRQAETVANQPSAQQKAKYLYQSCTNTKLLQKRGVEPLLNLINLLGGWPVLDTQWQDEQFDWLNLTARLRRFNNDILIVQWVGPDIKNSDENVVQFDQTSLGLPTREYFLQEMNAKYLQAYQTFMVEVMHKLGAPMTRAQETAAELIRFETQLARITSPAEQRLNVTKLYKRLTLRQLSDTVPDIDWIRYLSILQQRQVLDSEEIVIYAKDYMNDLVTLLTNTDRETVANYLMWRFVRHRINNVDERFEESKQAFYHSLFGREESPQRWKVCIAQVNTNMGMALGAMFVAKYFDENSKRDTLRMTHELQQAFRDILKTTDWLDTDTKHLAELKVNAMSLKIGYPDFILNPDELNEKYAGLTIHPDRYFENTLNVLLHTSRQEQNKLHEAVNKTTWQTAPAIVNAYYSRNKNQIMFPAGILQPPFYHHYFPRSLNFGGIGVVIGHELTHGFDDKGRLFDRNGSIHKWWSDTAIKGFDERARCIIAQYSNYTVGEVGIALNGESTQGENIADNGGLRQAFHAYKRWLQENPEAEPDERLPGLNLTGEQLFFLNFGQVWCGAMRPEAVRNKLNTAIHSPGRFRVIGTLSNSKDFAQEFNCPAGSPMNPVHKCSVW